MTDAPYRMAKEHAALAAAFESPWLRRLAYLGVASYLIAAVVLSSTWSSTTPAMVLVRYYLFEAPVWFSLGTLALYYGHLAARRYRIGLGPFLLLALVWCNATAFTWALAGWEAGLTVALGLAAAMAYARCWSGSVACLLDVTQRARQAALFVLGLAHAASYPGLLLGSGALALGLKFWTDTLVLAGIGLLAFSLPVQGGALYLSFRARKAARKLLETKTVNPAVPILAPARAAAIPAPRA